MVIDFEGTVIVNGAALLITGRSSAVLFLQRLLRRGLDVAQLPFIARLRIGDDVKPQRLTGMDFLNIGFGNARLHLHFIEVGKHQNRRRDL